MFLHSAILYQQGAQSALQPTKGLIPCSRGFFLAVWALSRELHLNGEKAETYTSVMLLSSAVSPKCPVLLLLLLPHIFPGLHQLVGDTHDLVGLLSIKHNRQMTVLLAKHVQRQEASVKLLVPPRRRRRRPFSLTLRPLVNKLRRGQQPRQNRFTRVATFVVG